MLSLSSNTHVMVSRKRNASSFVDDDFLLFVAILLCYACHHIIVILVCASSTIHAAATTTTSSTSSTADYTNTIMSLDSTSSTTTAGSTTGTISIEWWIEMIHLVSHVDQWHEQLPSPFNTIMDKILLNHVPYADEYLFLICVILCILILIQTKALTRPPPVPLKSLPKRPCLLIQFQPDDPNVRNTSSGGNGTSINQNYHSPSNPLSQIPMKGTPTTTSSPPQSSTLPQHASFIQRIDGFMAERLSFRRHRHPSSSHNNINHSHSASRANHPSSHAPHITHNDSPKEWNSTVTHSSRTGRRYPSSTAATTSSTANQNTPSSMSFSKTKSKMVGPVETVLDDDDDELNLNDDEEEWLHDYDYDHDDDANMEDSDVFRNESGSFPIPQHHPLNQHHDEDDTPFVVLKNSATMQDLPDSFAPLLSSSYMTMLTQQLTGDLIHAVQLEGEIRLRTGRHEVPLDKDTSRPQFVLDISEHSNGCRISAVAVIGSDGLSMEQDMDVHRLTTSRSKPMVKHAGLVFDPPLPLSNVAPTLIHFPTLFEDRNMIPTLRSIQFVRYIVDFIVSISSFLEKCLWILESQCQIHLSKVRITPIYKGQHKNQKHGGTTTTTNDTTTTTSTMKSPKWRLQLAFSGHVLIFGWIPIPFISVVLPSFIIPQPHALLDYLLSS